MTTLPPPPQSNSPLQQSKHDEFVDQSTNFSKAEASKISSILKAFKTATGNDNPTTGGTGSVLQSSSGRRVEASFSEKGFQDFTQSRRGVRIAFGIFLLYLILGTVVFAVWVEEWNAIDAAYFTVATFTTVGYGDLYPVTKGQRIFAMFFVTIGIMIIGGVVLGVVMNTLFAAIEKSVHSSKDSAQLKFLKKFKLVGSRSHHHDKRSRSSRASQVMASMAENVRSSSIVRSTAHNLGLAVLIFVPGIVIGHFEKWALHESIYYSIITATTVGYGDLSPKNKWTRLAACFYLPLCVTIMASIFSKITSAYLQKKTKDAEEEFFQRRLTRQDIEKMDIGGDGSVNPEEFLIFMLVNMGKVDEKTIQNIQDLFHDLDKDGSGLLDAQDLLLMAYAVDEGSNDDV